MKVTAIIADEIVQTVQAQAEGKNLTESLVIALQEWISLRKLRKLNKLIQEKPLHFRDSFSAEKIRRINRKNS